MTIDVTVFPMKILLISKHSSYEVLTKRIMSYFPLYKKTHAGSTPVPRGALLGPFVLSRNEDESVYM